MKEVEKKEEMSYENKCLNSLKFSNRKMRRIYAKSENLKWKDIPKISKEENEKDLKKIKVLQSFSYQKELINFYKKYPKALNKKEEE